MNNFSSSNEPPNKNNFQSKIELQQNPSASIKSHSGVIRQSTSSSFEIRRYPHHKSRYLHLLSVSRDSHSAAFNKHENTRDH